MFFLFNLFHVSKRLTVKHEDFHWFPTLGVMSSGAGGDLQQVERMARAMVTQFGMSDVGTSASEYCVDESCVFFLELCICWNSTDFCGVQHWDIFETCLYAIYKYIYIHLEPKWPLFLKVNPPKQGRTSNQKEGHLGSRCTCIYVYICIYRIYT